VVVFITAFVVQIVYFAFFHALSKFPGPFLASFTNLWKTYQVARGDYEGVLLRLHQKHGKIVRIGPNHLDISDAQAVKAIFGSGRTFQKRSVRHNKEGTVLTSIQAPTMTRSRLCGPTSLAHAMKRSIPAGGRRSPTLSRHSPSARWRSTWTTA
jgi:hypothetical protein